MKSPRELTGSHSTIHLLVHVIQQGDQGHLSPITWPENICEWLVASDAVHTAAISVSMSILLKTSNDSVERIAGQPK